MAEEDDDMNGLERKQSLCLPPSLPPFSKSATGSSMCPPPPRQTVLLLDPPLVTMERAAVILTLKVLIVQDD